MLVPSRHGSSDSYRYGFQGQEKDDEIKGEGNSLNYTFRMHDPRIGRFFAIDPLTKKYPHYTPYSFSGNKVIQYVELEGLEESGTNAGSAIMSIFFPLPPKIKNNPQKYPGAHGLNLAGKAAAVSVAAPPILTGTTVAYESYTTWYGTSMLGNYFAAGSGMAGMGGTASAAMIDANAYFGASFWQTNASKGVINGLSNIIGQVAYNGGFENFNYSQPIFAGFVGNPFLSNFGESFFSVTAENGFTTNNFNSNFFSTFGSNYIGGKIGDTFEVSEKLYMSKVLNLTSGGATETFENKIGDSLEQIQQIFKDFKIDMSFSTKKEKQSKKFN
ncbi:RHS repeat-associated core domain-containing protein [Flavobacterium sp. KACC 22763]|uniref:RHS repeat-associated core domain-containing protein n=1 Tax=Flavobacterium sp. KACC 22763 TaxID=3025668 RepID=UPI003FCD3630